MTNEAKVKTTTAILNAGDPPAGQWIEPDGSLWRAKRDEVGWVWWPLNDRAKAKDVPRGELTMAGAEG